jgi:serine/threonine protein kinase
MNYIINSLVNLLSVDTERRTIRQTGGELLDQGGFGCVYSPAFYFDKNDKIMKHMDDSEQEYISKLTSIHDGEQEIEMNNKINKIDPKHIFTPRMVLSQQISLDMLRTIETDESINACESTHQEMYNIVMDDAGTSILKIIDIMNNNDSYYIDVINKLYKSFSNVVIGLDIMYSHNFIHMDIKTDNILFDFGGGDDNVKSNIIDFGVSIDLTDKIRNLQLEDYYMWSVENNVDPIEIIKQIHIKMTLPIEHVVYGLLFYDINDPRIQSLDTNDELLYFIYNSFREGGVKLEISDIASALRSIKDMLYYYSPIIQSVVHDRDDVTLVKFMPEFVELCRKIFMSIDAFCFGHVLSEIVEFDFEKLKDIERTKDEDDDDESIRENSHNRIIKYKQIAEKLSCIDMKHRISIHDVLDMFT